MPIESVVLGQKPNDGGGDPLRVAFEKVNRNFETIGSAVAARTRDMPSPVPAHEHKNYVPRILAPVPPAEPPQIFGAMWIDTVSGRIYLATGTASVADWREILLAPR